MPPQSSPQPLTKGVGEQLSVYLLRAGGRAEFILMTSQLNIISEECQERTHSAVSKINVTNVFLVLQKVNH